MGKLIDGFWFPKGIHEQLLSRETEYATLSFVRGRPCEPEVEGAITVRWPRLAQEQWKDLLRLLRDNRAKMPKGQAFWDRFQAAMGAFARRLAEPSDPIRSQALSVLPGYTGFSEAMIRFTISALDLWELDRMPAAFSLAITNEAALAWQPMQGLPGRLHFYSADAKLRMLQRLPGLAARTLFRTPDHPELVVGYGAGNVPGTALLISILGLATTLAGVGPPALVVRNSRREPIFTPLVLKGLEAMDPDLVSTLAVLVWDYEEPLVQETLLSEADLLIAAASDETIAQIEVQIENAKRRQAASSSGHARGRPIRFHAHGHKVSFSAIGKEVLAHGLNDRTTGHSLLDMVSLLAALDSIFWDQYGCLSSRIHFVENGGEGHYGPLEYASRLGKQLRMLGDFIPRGAWPRQHLHDRFDRYKQLETTGQVHVLSNYEDEFVLAVDQRQLNADAFRSLVNDCQGRVVIVRPIDELEEVPDRYLRWLPENNLQSLSVAVGYTEKGLSARFLDFAKACGERGVTAIRSLGRGAFPQLSYSWDGLIPLDLEFRRPPGRFTSIEFESPYEQMVETYKMFLEHGSALGLGEGSSPS